MGPSKQAITVSDSSVLSVRESYDLRPVLNGLKMKMTRYFEEQVLRKRPYIRSNCCEQALRETDRREVQSDGGGPTLDLYRGHGLA